MGARARFAILPGSGALTAGRAAICDVTFRAPIRAVRASAPSAAASLRQIGDIDFGQGRAANRCNRFEFSVTPGDAAAPHDTSQP